MLVENQISQHDLSLGPLFSPRGPKCQNFDNVVFQARVLKILEKVGYVHRESNQST